MCLDKKTKSPKIAKEDIYVLKYGTRKTLNREFFTRIMTFSYPRGVMMSKMPSDRIAAYNTKRLEGQVFHAFSPMRTNQLMKNMGTHTTLSKKQFGVFMIPAGSLYWLGAADDIGSTEIMYMGNTEKAFQLIKPNQCV